MTSRRVVLPLFALLVGCQGDPSASPGEAGVGAGHDTGTPSDPASDAESMQDPGAHDAGGVDSVAHDAGRDDPALPVCEASEQGSRPLGVDKFVANTGKKAVAALTYTNVGAAGDYAQVVTGWSKATGCVGDKDGSLCRNTYRKPKHVEGPLAPFNEEMSLVFAGPVELYQVAVYAPDSASWKRTAYWDRCQSSGLAFTGNKSWYECGGFVQSYVTADGTKETAQPVLFSGSIAAGTEVHVMSSKACSGSDAASDCGWSSGLPLHGFQGDSQGSKIFATKFRMPIGSKTPAYWILPSQVLRSSQYGCNCRGAGSDPVYKGGCGELDVAEILGGVTTSLEATTTLYSFQDITGGGDVTFERPVLEAATFLVIFDAASRQIAIRRLGGGDFDFGSTIPAQRVSEWLSQAGTVRALD
ncbi:MAG: DUF2403 domain-containing protein [Myxococcales bacterium]